jgi:hypothetical protein
MGFNFISFFSSPSGSFEVFSVLIFGVFFFFWVHFSLNLLTVKIFLVLIFGIFFSVSLLIV